MKRIPLLRARSSTLAWLGVLLLAPLDGRGGIRLNDRFPLVPGGDVYFVEFSSSSARIVYVADAEEEGVLNVYSVPADGNAAPLKLSDVTDSGHSITGLRISPDGTRVLYSLRPPSTATDDALYSVPVDGSAPPVDLTGPHLSSYQVTQDSTRVLFRGDVFTSNRFLLYSVPIDGSAGAIILSGPVTAGGDVEEFAISPDGTRVVYRADANVDGRYELFSAPLAGGGAAVQLNSPLQPNGDVAPEFRIAADGARVVYLADQVTDEVFELFSAPIDGSAAAVRLNAPLSGGKDVEADFVLSPDWTRVVYRADQVTDGVVELFSAPIDGSAAAIALNPTLVAGGNVQADPLVSADGTHVVYRADQVSDELFELFSVPIDGSAAALRLSGTLAAGEDVQPGFVNAPNGARVAFPAGPAGASTLFSVPIDGSAAPLALDSDAVASISELVISANNARVFYAKPDLVGAHLWSVPLDGSAAAVALSAGENLSAYRLIYGGSGVLYIADENLRTVFELFARPANGLVAALRINPTFPNTTVPGSVFSFTVAGERAVYGADPGLSDVTGLYSVPLSAGRAPVCISARSGTPIHVLAAQSLPIPIGAGGTRAVFRGRTGAGLELYSAPLDGSSEPVMLNAPLQPGGDVTAFELSPDGSRVIYLADQDTDGVFELYRAEIDGSGSPLKLNGALVPGGNVRTGFQSNADGSRVIYVAPELASIDELYAADGIHPPVKLSSPIVAPSGRVQLDPQISADGAWVFYRADANVHLFMELFRAPIDGSTSAVNLSSGVALSVGGVHEGYRITPDGTRALFVAFGVPSNQDHLFSVPADASTAPVRLNSARGTIDGVSEVALDPLGVRAVFRNDPSGEACLFSVPVDGSTAEVQLNTVVGNQYVLKGVWEISPDAARVVFERYTVSCCAALYSVPIDASAPPTRLDGSLADAFLWTFRIDPSAQSVAFVGSQSRSLFLVPIDGSSAPVQASRPFGSTATGVTNDQTFSPDGAELLYRIDGRQAVAYDLYALPLERMPRVADPPVFH